MTRLFFFRHSAVTILFALAVLVVLSVAAFAQSAAPASTAVDVSPLLGNVVWPVLGTIATALAGWIAQKAAAWFHLQNQDVVRGYVGRALQTGLDVAYARLGGAPLSIETHSQTVASIASYLITAVPDGLKALGFTLQPDDPKLLALVGARLEAQATVPAAPAILSPAIVPAAPPGPAAS